MNVYILEDRQDTEHFFTVDDILIRQIQEYQNSEWRNETFADHFKVFYMTITGISCLLQKDIKTRLNFPYWNVTRA